jgi:hypothetical protein
MMNQMDAEEIEKKEIDSQKDIKKLTKSSVECQKNLLFNVSMSEIYIAPLTDNFLFQRIYSLIEL